MKRAFILNTLLCSGYLFFAAALPASAQRSRNPRLDSLLNEKDSIVQQQQVEKLTQSDKEADMNLLVQFYARKDQNARAEEVMEKAISLYPKGEFAFVRVANAIVGEKDPAKKEKMLLAAEADFPGQNYDMYNYDVAYTYAGEKGGKIKTDKVMYYTGLIGNGEFHNGAYALIAEQLLNNGEAKLAETLVTRSIDSLKTIMQTAAPTPARSSSDGAPPRSIKAEYARFLTLYAKILLQENRPAEALRYAKEAYDSSDKSPKNNNSVYMTTLMANGDLKDAFPFMERAYRWSEATPEVRQKFREAYVQAHGTDKGYDELMASVENDMKISTAASLAEAKVAPASAPVFTLNDIEGRTVSLASLKGKIVILDFWATWCGPCKKSFPAMQMAINKYRRDTSVVFLFIDTWEHIDNPQPDVSAFIRDNKYSFQVLLDLKDPATKINKVVDSYKIKGIPTKFVINKNGDIVYRLTGFSGSDEKAVAEISAMIESARKNKPA